MSAQEDCHYGYVCAHMYKDLDDIACCFLHSLPSNLNPSEAHLCIAQCDLSNNPPHRHFRIRQIQERGEFKQASSLCALLTFRGLPGQLLSCKAALCVQFPLYPRAHQQPWHPVHIVQTSVRSRKGAHTKDPVSLSENLRRYLNLQCKLPQLREQRASFLFPVLPRRQRRKHHTRCCFPTACRQKRQHRAHPCAVVLPLLLVLGSVPLQRIA